ncbi:ABC transporter ATP-binding protein [Methanobrevibacter filiformis]|uniref:Putative ABC transporter ATP-binding protein n=1 Tax=Methanobrevibacter filiformis TaxID=55758 RepID=A0A166AL30_9EURY|nr:ABC transporter ATP-binding protein [Methanobrevibacter filiformis]KZX12176.1 putative ABC transporter ATP-binding protein [Methanobrevibacter filiformis]
MKIIEMKDGSGSYFDNMIFENISFKLERGDVFSILGPNGIGKTTLLKTLLGIKELNHGELLIKGENITDLTSKEISKVMAYVPQNHYTTFPFKVIDVVLMGRSPHISLTETPEEKDIKISEKALKDMNIHHLRDKEYNNLSGGEIQLVFLARALAQKSEVLVLDEPTSHLDFGNQLRLLETIKKLAKKDLAIIMSSHYPDHSFISSNKVAIMQNKTFIDMGPPDLVVNEENLKKAYDLDISIVELEKGRKVCVSY